MSVRTEIVHIISCWLILLAGIVICRPGLAQASDIDVFILHSYHQEYPWTRQQNLGLVSKLEVLLDGRDVSFATEYLDTKRVFLTEAYQQFFSEYLQRKYAGYMPDIIFLTDDNALKFMELHRDEFFPGIPVVFCGVNDTSYAEEGTGGALSGVIEVKDIPGNLQLVKELFPDIDRVTFVGDNSSTYQTIYRQILASAAFEFPLYDLNFIADRRMDQVENLLRATAGEVVVLTTIGGFTNRDGQILSIDAVLDRVRRLGEYAVISMEDVYMKEGILGGIVTSGEAQGRSAAEIGVSILGEIEAAHRVVYGANIPTFDYRELERLKLPTSRLPRNAVILNAPLSLYKEFGEVLLAGLLILVILSGLVVFLLINIRKRKKLESGARESSSFLKTVLDNLPDAVCVKSAADLRYVRLNRTWEDLYGFRADKVIGKRAFDFLSREEAEASDKKEREVLEGGSLVDIPVESCDGPSGRKFLHTKKLPVFDDEGRPRFLLSISRDITEELAAEESRQELEEQLKQSRKMESIGTLAGGIAHDFNNILSSIIGYAELAKLEPGLSEKAHRYLDGSLKGAERAKQLVRQILTFSRKTKQNREPVILADIVEESISLLKSSLPSTIDIRVELYSRASVLSDPTQMQQVVMNLCTNGYQAMQGGGGILLVNLCEYDAVEAAAAGMVQVPPGRYLHLAVTDSGCGMDNLTIERIFDPYFTTKGSEAGTGLGLAVVHGIVKGHGGYVAAETELNKGTTVSVYLPVAEDADDISHEPVVLTDGDKTSIREGMIMLVDDEPAITDLTSRYFETKGYKTISFTDSREALREYQRHPDRYDLVVTDMTMPHLTGIELSRKIRELNEGARIILCTGYSDMVDMGMAREAGIWGYLAKPVSFSELQKAVDTVLSGAYFGGFGQNS